MHIIDAIGVDEAKNMSAIAAKLMVTVGTLTVNMNSLEKKGYIERSLHKGNRRITDVYLTKEGRDKCARNYAIMNDYWETVLSEMGNENLKDLLRISNELVDRMEEVYQEKKAALKI